MSETDARQSFLRRRLAAWIAALALMTIAVSATLIVLISFVHSASTQLSAAAEKVFHVERAELHLLLHQRAADPITRIQQEQSLIGNLEAARRWAATPAQHDALEDAIAAVGRYLAQEQAADNAQAKAFNRAYHSVERLSGLTIADSRAAQEHVNQLDRAGTAAGYVMVALSLASAGLLAAWILTAFRPVEDIVAAMRRFAQGDRAARAGRQRYAEFDALAQHFNHMAEALDEHRRGQLAYVAGVAHDLRNPLQALKLSLWMVRPDHPLPAEERLRETFRMAQRQVGRLERMLSDLMDRSRLEAGKLELIPEWADLRALASEVAELFQPGAPGHRFKIIVGDDEPVAAWCDPARVEQILNNLVSNAVKYAPGSDVVIKVWKDQENALVSVADHGPGIAQEELEGIFEPYRRSPDLAASAPGVGLGLHFARTLARAHGGDLEVRSEKGHGATFTLRLPRPPEVGK